MNFVSKGLLALALLAAAFPAQAEEEEKIVTGRWYNSLETGLNLTQSSYSDNWNGGGNGTLAWTAFLNGSGRRKFENSIDWTTTLKLRFGQSHQQTIRSNGDKGWNRPQKSDDKIDLETLGLLAKGWEADPYLSARFESQFLDQADPFGRDLFVNPMVFKESAGVARKFLDREKEFFLTRLGFTARQNRRSFFTDVTGDVTDSRTANDAGAEFQADWFLQLASKRLGWAGKFAVYQPFAWSASSKFDAVSADSLSASGVPADVKDFATVADVSWENTFTTDISKHIAFSLYMQFVYDKYDNSVVPIVDSAGTNLQNPGAVEAAIRKEVQWRQSFAIGVTYRFL